MTPRRVERILLALAVVATTFSLAVGAVALADRVGRDDEPSVNLVHDVVYTVGADGSLGVVQDLTYDYAGPRQGPSRTYQLSGTPWVPTDFAVTRDGETEPFSLTESDGVLAFRVGRPDRLLEGRHAYRISYRFPAVAKGTSPEVRLRWQLIPRGWTLTIERARISVRLPAAARVVACSVGARTPCELTGDGTRVLTLDAADLPPKTGVVLELTYPRPTTG